MVSKIAQTDQNRGFAASHYLVVPGQYKTRDESNQSIDHSRSWHETRQSSFRDTVLTKRKIERAIIEVDVILHSFLATCII